VPRLADIIGTLDARNLSEWSGLLGNVSGSSVPLGGEDPMLASMPSIPRSPNAELRRSRIAVLPNCDLRGNEDGGDSTPKREGTDAANGPLRAAIETPLLSKELGSGASSTDRCFCVGGEIPKPPFCSGEPYAGDADVTVMSTCCCSYPIRGPYW